jgi:CBS domain-containing protein
MQRDVQFVREDATVAAVIDLLVREHLHGVPVVNRRHELVGVVSQQDVLFGSMTRTRRDGGVRLAPASRWAALRVKEIMTFPAVSATEQTSVKRVCQVMHRLRIHRVPIVRRGKLVGIIGSLDVCGAVARGESLD